MTRDHEILRAGGHGPALSGDIHTNIFERHAVSVGIYANTSFGSPSPLTKAVLLADVDTSATLTLASVESVDTAARAVAIVVS